MKGLHGGWWSVSHLRWYPDSGGGWTAISALELLWQFIFDTGSLPPFCYDGRWRSAEDHVLDGFVLPPAKTLYRVWVRHLVACDGLRKCESAASLAALGAAFPSRLRWWTICWPSFDDVPGSALCGSRLCGSVQLVDRRLAQAGRPLVRRTDCSAM